MEGSRLYPSEVTMVPSADFFSAPSLVYPTVPSGRDICRNPSPSMETSSGLLVDMTVPWVKIRCVATGRVP